MKLVEFDDDLAGHAAKGRGRAHGGGQGDFARGRNIAGLDHGPMDRAEKSIADVLRCHRKVHVKKLSPAFIDALAQGGVGLVGGAKQHGVGLSQRTVQRLAG